MWSKCPQVNRPNTVLTYTVYCNILYTLFLRCSCNCYKLLGCRVPKIAGMKFTHEDFLLSNCIQPSNFSNSKPSSFLLALIRVCITWTTTLNSLPCYLLSPLCNKWWARWRCHTGWKQLRSWWCETLWNRACRCRCMRHCGIHMSFFATATHHNNLSHWQSKKAISACAESVAALQPFLITTSEAVLLTQAFWSLLIWMNTWIFTCLYCFLHLFYLFLTSFYYLTNHCGLSIFRPMCRVNEPKEPKDSSEPTLREAWRCGEIGEPGFVPNSIQIGRNSTNFYPILPTFWR